MRDLSFNREKRTEILCARDFKEETFDRTIFGKQNEVFLRKVD